MAKEYEILREEINSNLDDYDVNFSYINQSKKIDSEENKPIAEPFESTAEEKEEQQNKDDYFELNILNLFEYCYELDLNELPARFKLKHLDKIFPKYNSKDPTFDKVWSKIELKLGNIFRNVANVCLNKKLITPVQHERYFVSGFKISPSV